MPPRKRADILKNLRLMNFLMEYFSVIDKTMYEKAIKDQDPASYLAPGHKRFLDALDEIQVEIGKVVDGQKQGKDTSSQEVGLLRRFIRELTDYAKFAAARTSSQEIAALMPRAQLFDGIQQHLKKFGGDKIAALVDIYERQRNFDDSLDRPFRPKPKIPLLPPPKPPKP